MQSPKLHTTDVGTFTSRFPRNGGALALVALLALTGCGKKPGPKADVSTPGSRTSSAPIKPVVSPEPKVQRTLGGIELDGLVEAGAAGEAIIESALGLSSDKAKGVAGLVAGGAASGRVVRALLASKSIDEVTGALEVLAADGDPSQSRKLVVEPLLGLLGHEVALVRDRAWTLAPLVVEGDDLLALVKRVEPAQKATVIRLLETWDSETIRVELAKLARGEDRELGREAAYALTTPTRPASPEALTLASDLLTAPASRPLGLAVVRRLPGPLPTDLQKLVSRTIDESLMGQDLPLILAAARATVVLPIEERLPLLEQLGRDAREDVRRVAAETLGLLSGAPADTLTRVVEVLDRLLADPEGMVRIAAIRARATLSVSPELAPVAATAILQKLQDGHRGVRLAAAVGLAQPAYATHSKAALEAQLLREDKPGRALILEAMAASKSRDLVEIVISKLDGGVLVPAAYQALTAASGKDFRAVAADWRPWLDETFPAPAPPAPKAEEKPPAPTPAPAIPAPKP